MSLTMSIPLDHLPAGRPPPGVIPNFVDPESKAHTLLTLEYVFLSLALVAVIVRLYVRTRLVRVWGWDDTTKIGFGRHIWDIPVSMLLGKSYLLSVNGIIYPLTMLFAKLSILFLYIRIFSINRGVKTMIYVGVAILSLFYTAMACIAVGSIVICNGLNADSITFCHNYSGPIVLLNSAFNTVTDFWILILPIPLITKLQLPLKRKLGVLAVFAAGLAACAASLTRLIEFCIHYRSSDVLWIQAINAQIVEMDIAIIVTCVSCFPSFFKQSRVAILSTTSSLRKRLSGSSRGSQHSLNPLSRIARGSRLKKQSSEGMKHDSHIELQETTPPQHSFESNPYHREPRV
ncbi:hypothetical protein PG988_002203 [Apiospora saccharicola]